jgi:hypothetical protein
MPWLNRRLARLDGVSGRCSRPRLKRGGRHFVANRASPRPYRPMRRRHGGMGLRPMPSSKLCSVFSRAMGCSLGAIDIDLVLPIDELQPPSRMRGHRWGVAPIRSYADHVWAVFGRTACHARKEPRKWRWHLRCSSTLRGRLFSDLQRPTDVARPEPYREWADVETGLEQLPEAAAARPSAWAWRVRRLVA